MEHQQLKLKKKITDLRKTNKNKGKKSLNLKTHFKNISERISK